MTMIRPAAGRTPHAVWLAGSLAVLLASCGGGGGSGGDTGGETPGGGEPPVDPEPLAYFDADWQLEALPAPSEEAPAGEWLATDTHVHSDHSSDGSMFRQASGDALPGNVSVKYQIDETERKGLDFVAITDHRTYDQHWDPLWRSEKLLLIPGEEANGRPHANVFGGVDTVLDGMDGPAGSGHRPTQQSIWDASAQGAVWQVNHPDRDGTNDDGSANEHGSVIGVHLAEAWNRARFQYLEQELLYAESRWNLGMEFGLTASSDNHMRELRLFGFGPGSVRTHVYTPARSERAILHAMRQGRTVLTGGDANDPLLTLEADAQGDGVFEAVAGDAVVAPGNLPVTLRLRVRRGSGHVLRVYAAPGGRAAGPVATLRPGSSDETFLVPVVRPLDDQPFWVYAELGNLFGTRTALTSPLFIRSGAVPVPAGELPVPASLALPDDAARVIGERGQFSGFADVAGDSAGVPLVVAEQHDRTGTDVLFRRGDAAAAVRLNRLGHSARFPRIAVAGNQVWVVWEDERLGQVPRRPQIILRGSADGGRSWGDEHLLTRGDSRAIRPAVAALADGSPVVAWSDNARRCFDLFVQVGLDGAATNLSDEKECHGGHAFDTRSTLDPASLHPALAVRADGSVTLVFQDNRYDVNPGWTGEAGFHEGLEGLDRTDPDNWEILARTRDPATGAWSPVVRVSNNGDPDNAMDETALADRHPAVTTDGGGRLIAVWDTKVLRSSGVNSTILGSVSEDGGLSWSVAEPIGTQDDAMSQRPALARTSDGGVRVVWMDTRDIDWRHRVWGSSWRPGSGWSGTLRLSGTGNAGWPRISGEHLVFNSDRGAEPQRDPTWLVLYRRTQPVGEVMAAARLRVAGAGTPQPETLAGWRARWQARVTEMPPLEDCEHMHPH